MCIRDRYRDGHTNHYFFPIEGYEPVTRIHSDNHLWVVMAVYALVMEEGQLAVSYTHLDVYKRQDRGL